MRLPNIPSSTATVIMAVAITLVTWLVLIWPGTDTRRPAPAATEPSISYVDMTIKERPSDDSPAPP